MNETLPVIPERWGTARQNVCTSAHELDGPRNASTLAHSLADTENLQSRGHSGRVGPTAQTGSRRGAHRAKATFEDGLMNKSTATGVVAAIGLVMARGNARYLL